LVKKQKWHLVKRHFITPCLVKTPFGKNNFW
jgi:hypothetical protein